MGALRSVLNEVSELAFLICVGSVFHILGPFTENGLSAKVEQRVLGTAKREQEVDERRCLC